MNDGRDVREITGDEDFISLADLVRMVWRHRLGIVLFTALVTLLVGGVSLMSPRPYEASALMEVLPRYGGDGRVDKDLFETMVLTQLETAKSPIIGMRVLRRLKKTGLVDVDLPALMSGMEVSRPPRTSIIQCKISTPSPDKSLEIITIWRDESIQEVERKTVAQALVFIRGRLKDIEEGWLQQFGALEEARRNAERLESEKLISVSRSVDDTVLWQDLVKNFADADIKRMADLNLKSEEMNPEYLAARTRLADLEQRAAGVAMSRNFFKQVVALLEARLEGVEPAPIADVSESLYREALGYTDTLIASREVVTLGDPVVYRGSRGALKKTALAGFGMLFCSCLVAFVYEWARQLGLK